MIEGNKRRKLLKAVAVVPVIATIPSGSVFANASVHGCIVSSGEQSNDGYVPVVVDRADEYLRVTCSWGELKVKGETNFKVEPCYEINGKYFDSDGVSYAGQDIEFKKMGERNVLVLVVPNELNTDVEVVGVWPEAQMGDGNIALTGSCWTSLNPSSGDVV